MKRTDTLKRTDVILSVGMLVLVLLALALMVATGSTDEFVGTPPQRPELVYKAPLFPAILLLRL